jgi:hypothetical protein
VLELLGDPDHAGELIEAGELGIVVAFPGHAPVDRRSELSEVPVEIGEEHLVSGDLGR